MLPEILIYIVKINLAIVLFFGFYKLILQRDTFFKLKRFCLLSILFVSLIYPFWNISGSQTIEKIIESDIIPVYNLPEVLISTNTELTETFSFPTNIPLLVLIIMITVACILLFRFGIQLFSVFYKINKAEKSEVNGLIIYEIPRLKTPFSFFRWIVLDSNRYTSVELEEILLHESTHVRQLHTIDIMIAEILCIFCWFNPFVWMLRREIRMNLEYLADRSVLDSGYEAEHYQFHLLHISQYKTAVNLSNNFNVSPLKKRIIMMNKKESKNTSVFKYALLMPICLFLVLSNNLLKAGNIQEKTIIEPALPEEETVSVPQNTTPEILRDEEPQEEKTPAKKQNKKTIQFTAPQKTEEDVEKKEEAILHFVEVMPQFPGGNQALIEYLSKNIKYPKEAFEEKIQGTVLLRFVINADGSVSNVEVIRTSKNELLDEEAVRVVKSMPKWVPGENKGEKVRVYFNLPIKFHISEDENTKYKKSGEYTTCDN